MSNENSVIIKVSIAKRNAILGAINGTVTIGGGKCVSVEEINEKLNKR